MFNEEILNQSLLLKAIMHFRRRNSHFLCCRLYGYNHKVELIGGYVDWHKSEQTLKDERLTLKGMLFRIQSTTAVRCVCLSTWLYGFACKTRNLWNLFLLSFSCQRDYTDYTVCYAEREYSGICLICWVLFINKIIRIIRFAMQNENTVESVVDLLIYQRDYTD